MAEEIGINKLPDGAVARCTKDARKDGVFAGLSAGLVGAILGSKVFRFNKNTTIVCGIMTGVLSGYQFTQAFLSSNLARLRAELAERERVEALPTGGVPSVPE